MATRPEKGRNCACGTRLSVYNPDGECTKCMRHNRADQPPVVPDDFWDHPDIVAACKAEHLGSLLLAYRRHPYHGDRGPIGQQTLARWMRCNQSAIAYAESQPPGLRLTYRRVQSLTRYADTLGIPERLQWWLRGDPSDQKVSPTDRKQFLQVGTIAVAAPLLGELTAIRELLSGRNTDLPAVGQLEKATIEVGRAYRIDPLKVGPSIGVGLRRARELLSGSNTLTVQQRLHRVIAKLCLLSGDWAFDTMDYPTATEWYRLAVATAVDVGDTHLADMALAAQGYVPLYGGRPDQVVSLLSPRLEEVRSRPASTPGAAFVAAMISRGYADVGDRNNYFRAVECAEETFGRAPARLIAPSALSFPLPRLRMMAAAGLKAPRDLDAITARIQARGLYPPSESIDVPTIDLGIAKAHLANGDMDEACRVAVRAITSSGFHGSAVRTRTTEFHRLLPASRCPGSYEWNRVYQRTIIGESSHGHDGQRPGGQPFAGDRR